MKIFLPIILMVFWKEKKKEHLLEILMVSHLDQLKVLMLVAL